MTETAAPANPTEAAPTAQTAESEGLTLPILLLGLGLLGIVIGGIIYFYRAYIRHEVPKERSFDLLILNFTFVLPLLSAFALDALNKLKLSSVTIPTDSGSVAALDPKSMLVMGIVVLV